MHGGRVVARALAQEGVSHLFTLCGGHIQAIYDGCLDEGIRVVDFRHEQAAAHAAEGWARATGRPGVAAVTAGPGVTDAVTAVANAQRAQTPMILIGGQGPRQFLEMGSLQEMDHVGLMKTITKWSISVPESRRLAEFVSIAFRKATTGVPGPVFLEMPLDVLMDSPDDSETNFPLFYRTEAAPGGDPEYIQRAAELLSTAQRPMALVGSQWWWSRYRDALYTFRDTFKLPIFVNGMARGALRPDDPYFFSRCRAQALKDADVIVIFGTPLDFRIGYGRPPRIPEESWLIQVDLDPSEIGRNRGVQVGIHGDIGLTMKQMAEAAGHVSADRPEWLASLRRAEDKAWGAMQAEMASDSIPINPLRMCAELAPFIDDKTIVIGDGGDIVATGANVFKMQRPGQWMDPGPLGTLGIGPSYAMAAKLARPDHRVLVLYGDGSFGLNGMEFEAAARQNIPFVGVIGNDAGWTQIRRGQVQLYGEDRAPATGLAYTRYEKMVEALGGYGEWVERPEDIGPAVERAFASGKPALVNVKIGGSDFRKMAISV